MPVYKAGRTAELATQAADVTMFLVLTRAVRRQVRGGGDAETPE